jgi:hypothetical protein
LDTAVKEHGDRMRAVAYKRVAIVLCIALPLMSHELCSDYRSQEAIIGQDSRSGCDASRCHESTPLQGYPPVSGKHSVHLDSATVIDCSDCHYNYTDHPLHKNGIINGFNAVLQLQVDGDIVFFNPENPGATWTNGPATCDNMNCHGSVSWYAAGELSCVDCHSPGSLYDPLPYEKHDAHLNSDCASFSFNCEYCHLDYRDQESHMDGTLDSADVVFFDPLFGGDWDNGSSSCSNLGCHGNSIWNSSSQLACTSCHNSSYSAYYPDPYGTDQGRHQSHLDSHGCTCMTCHDGYADLLTHINGSSDLDNDSVNLVIFQDPATYQLTWSDTNESCTRSGLGCHSVGGNDTKMW